jgi:hypothetical protein
MAWGRSSVPPPPQSALVYVHPLLNGLHFRNSPTPNPPASNKTQNISSKLLPLILLLLFCAIFAVIGYYLYLSVQQISNAATAKLESKNVSFTKDGLRVGVKELKNERYVDKTQSILVKAWNLSTWPAYKSRLWNKQQPAAGAAGAEGAKERKPYVSMSSLSNMYKSSCCFCAPSRQFLYCLLYTLLV